MKASTDNLLDVLTRHKAAILAAEARYYAQKADGIAEKVCEKEFDKNVSKADAILDKVEDLPVMTAASAIAALDLVLKEPNLDIAPSLVKAVRNYLALTASGKG